jgi:hypothetical protein
MMKNISKHISYNEAVKSHTALRYGIKNTPASEHLSAMKVLSELIFEPLREGLGNHPIGISSFFRNKPLNKLIGGAKNSQHCKGQAMDIDADIYGNLSNLDIFNFIKDNLYFDQLIWEFDNPDGSPAWVHVSYNGSENRNQILKATRIKNKVIYLNFPIKEEIYNSSSLYFPTAKNQQPKAKTLCHY